MINQSSRRWSDSTNIMELLPNPSPTMPPSPAIPLRLLGFLAGETVQVQGDTGDLQFSVQFSVRKKEHETGGDPSNSTGTNAVEVGNFRDFVQPSPSSPYLTPTSTDDDRDHNAVAKTVGEGSWSRGDTVTRLRSGVLSPVNYYSRGIYGVSRGSLSSGKKNKSNQRRRNGHNMFDKMLKRRSSPLRPCSSYSFFLVKNWDVVKCSSFVETSKRLSKQWCKLPQEEKKEYEDMALKDNARYKRQCMLLRNDVEQQATSGLQVDSI